MSREDRTRVIFWKDWKEGKKMSVMIGHARGGDPTYTPGDQTGNEVRTQPWYSGGWTVVLRPKSAATAEKMARFCEAVCKNEHVGYSQTTRNTLRDAARAAGWDGAKIAADCNCDCSSFMSACAEAAGVALPYIPLGGGKYNAPVTWTMRDAFARTGDFEVLTEAKYLTSDRYLRRGDVLVNEKEHTAMALSDGGLASVPEAAQNAAKPAEDPTPAAPQKSAKAKNTAAQRTHTIVWGDTLWGLAMHYGTSVPAICAANGIRATDYIYPGQVLKIPGGSA